MGLLERVNTAVKQRTWPIGSGAVELGDSYWGHDQSSYAPEDYGSYIATSNAVYACATLRARLLSSLPLLPYRLRPRLGKTAVETGPVVDLLKRPNPFWSWAHLAQTIELSLCLWGQAHLFVDRGSSGRRPPREIWWGRPDRVRPLTDPKQYITGYQYYPANTSAPIEFSASEVVWLRLPNPLDEFSGLAPLAAARLAADYASAAMRANTNLFQHGLHMGGVVSLQGDGGKNSFAMMTPSQADELANLIDRRFKGADNAHRWLVMRYPMNVQALSITPKDADYLGGMKESLEQVCRAYNVPLDLVGGQRTYENVDAAMRAMWNHCVKPEADWIADELTNQLLPMFGAPGVDLLEFDFGDVEELKEEESESWGRWQQQIAAGARTINEWREEQGLEPVEWGDVWWAPATLTPVENAELPEPEPVEPAAPPSEELPAQAPAEQPVDEAPEQEGEVEEEAAASPEPERGVRAAVPHDRQVIEYGSERHRELWQRFVARTEPEEERFGAMCAELFRRQRESVLAKLKAQPRGKRLDPWDEADFPFDKARWLKEFRLAARPRVREIAADHGAEALKGLGLGLSFDVQNPRVTRFIERRAQRFAREVNDTTWRQLKESLIQGIDAGEDMDALANRVEAVMGDRIASSKTVIARSEVIGAASGGDLLAYAQAQDTVGPLVKHWLAALDDRTRDSHVEAHQRYSQDGIPLEDDFQVGGGSGPGPGQIGLAEEDCNCRCTLTAELAPF